MQSCSQVSHMACHHFLDHSIKITEIKWNDCKTAYGYGKILKKEEIFKIYNKNSTKNIKINYFVYIHSKSKQCLDN